MTQFHIITLAVVTLAAPALNADEAGVKSRVLIDQAFDGKAMPANWEPGGRKDSFSIVDGSLRGVAQPNDSHGPSIGVPIKGRNLQIEFDIKSAKPQGYFLFLLDGDSQFKGQAHLLRMAVTAKQIQIMQDRGDPASKKAQKKQRDANGGKRVPPTKQQLDDPTFYRVERLAKQAAKPNDGNWHHIKITVSENEVTAQFDKKVPLTTTGTVLNVAKSRVVFLVGQSGDMRIDNVKVTELPSRL